MVRFKWTIIILVISGAAAGVWSWVKWGSPSGQFSGYAGSVSCRECHEKFYKHWSASFHGLAVQPYTPELARTNLTAQIREVVIGKYRFRADISEDRGWVVEFGPDGERKYRLEHVLGGKRVFYFLTPMEKGRLQTVPVAYDVKKKEWFDMAASGVRHIPGQRPEQPLFWKEWPYTFNTACFGCHVSQLSTNYDLKTDTYRTDWLEPGINCETCHGPAGEHVKVFRETPNGQRPPDIKIISTKKFTPEQHNSSCSSCHAKGSPVTDVYPPGEPYFDHFDLVTLEHPDFYPDGRDLGENYTYTSWRMSPCVKSGQLHCLGCHTSSGRYRFKGEEKANEACLPCHQGRVKHAAAHSRHKADSPGNKCISCHMPTTQFARMRRSDHSMLPPTPAATIKFKSPNACNICHTDKDAAWADRWVRQWRRRDYQAPLLYRAGLIEAARKHDWSRLPEMLKYLQRKDRDEVFANSLVRLLRACDNPRKWPAILKAMKDPSPLIRSSAADSLSAIATPEVARALIQATGDEVRLVRVRAAQALTHFPELRVDAQGKEKVDRAMAEHLLSITSQPDQWTSHYNLGNFYMNRNDLTPAIVAYETALKFDPRAIPPLVNLSLAYSRKGENTKAEETLRKAMEIEPENAEAHFNMGLLKAELKDLPQAEQHLRAALKADPQMAPAAYNLCVILGKDRPAEALSFCQKAASLRPQEPRYAYTLAFYQYQKGETNDAIHSLQRLIKQHPAYADPYLLLGEIYERRGQDRKAVRVYRQALEVKNLTPEDRRRIEMKWKFGQTSKEQKQRIFLQGLEYRDEGF